VTGHVLYVAVFVAASGALIALVYRYGGPANAMRRQRLPTFTAAWGAGISAPPTFRQLFGDAGFVITIALCVVLLVAATVVDRRERRDIT